MAGVFSRLVGQLEARGGAWTLATSSILALPSDGDRIAIVASFQGTGYVTLGWYVSATVQPLFFFPPNSQPFEFTFRVYGIMVTAELYANSTVNGDQLFLTETIYRGER